MSFDPADGLTDELADQIRSEIESGPQDEVRTTVMVRLGDPGPVELVLYDEDGDEPDVVATLTREQATALAQALLDAAADPG